MPVVIAFLLQAVQLESYIGQEIGVQRKLELLLPVYLNSVIVVLVNKLHHHMDKLVLPVNGRYLFIESLSGK